VVLGWLASVVLQPFGDPAFRMNLLAGLCVAVAAGLTVDLVRALTRSALLGIMAGLGLALTPIAWSIGTHAEAHALHLVFVAAQLRLLVAWEGRVRGTSAGAANRYLLPPRSSSGCRSATTRCPAPRATDRAHIGRWIARPGRTRASWCAAALVASVVVAIRAAAAGGPFRAAGLRPAGYVDGSVCRPRPAVPRQHW
jgi:hypothetical protein